MQYAQFDPDELFTSSDEKMFEYQDTLPSLPLPPLDQTLRKYLDSVRPHVSVEEYETTVSIVQKFAAGIGGELHHKLMERAKHQRNWLEKWWDDIAYMEFRYPVAPLTNFGGPGPEISHYWLPEEGTQIPRTALLIFYGMKYWEHVRKERIRVDKSGKGTVFCMNQYRRAFSTCRIPGIKKDQLKFYFKTESEGESPTNIIILCNGRIFTFEAVDVSGELLTPPEIERHLEYIRSRCQNLPPGQGIGTLTGDMRTTWAQMRNRLISLHPDNWRHLETIQKSVCLMVLEDFSVKDENEAVKNGLAGDSTNRWFDKSLSIVVFKNGLLVSNCDHSPFEAMVLVSNTFYVDLSIMRCKGKWQGSRQTRPQPKPDEIEFMIDDVIREAIPKAWQLNKSIADNVDVRNSTFREYGKSFLKNYKIHPDTHFQMALQFAYYRTYKKPAPTYETASTRKYWHGRTETVRSCTMEALQWCQAMCDPDSLPQTRLNLFSQAVNIHNKLMAEGQDNHGCDRHLTGLCAIAAEEGIPIPELYNDPSYNKSGGGANFVLSTSFVGSTTVHGGVSPMCENGYGVFYRVEDETYTMMVTAWKTDSTTDATTFTDTIYQSLRDMRNLLENHMAKGARL